MGRPRHTRRDANQAELVEDLRTVGAVVWDLADHGGEVLDLLVFWRGRARPIEVKQPGREDELTSDEEKSIEELRRAGVEAIVAARLEDVIKAW
jgi:hypothetical protein